jgi:DNA transformation protein and related proteins
MSAKPDEFRDYCIELLSGMRQGEIVARKMFGGAGFSIDGKTFAIIAFDQLWLKVDDVCRAEFVNANCRMFTYDADGKQRTMNYYTVPEDAMESAALMRPWAMLAWGVALRAAASKAAKPAAAKKSAPSTVGSKQAVAAKKTTRNVSTKTTKK